MERTIRNSIVSQMKMNGYDAVYSTIEYLDVTSRNDKNISDGYPNKIPISLSITFENFEKNKIVLEFPIAEQS